MWLKKQGAIVFLVLLIISAIYIFENRVRYGTSYEAWERSSSVKAASDGVGVLIDVNEKKLYVLKNGEILKRYPIATGKPDTPSPTGDFVITRKDRWGEGFGSAWLGLNVPWGKYGIHGTTSPGSIGQSASHGCIRMRNRDVDDLYKLVSVGTPVKIVSGPYGMMGNGYRVLYPGDRGADVLLVQTRLKKLGFYDGKADGIYGLAMERALNGYQKSKGMPVTNKIGESLYRNLGIVLSE